MVRRDGAAERAGRRAANGGVGVGAASGTRRNAAIGIELDVRRQGTRIGDGGTGGLAFFQRVFIGRRINLAEVVDTGIGLRGGARFHEVRDRDRGEEADDGHNDHDFDEREARFTDVLGRFHLLFFVIVVA